MHKTYTKHLKKIKELNREIQDAHGIKESLCKISILPKFMLDSRPSQRKFQEQFF